MKAVFGYVLIAMAVVVTYCCDCPKDGTEKYYKHEDCDKFYQCANGEKVVMICPGHLYFNETVNLCDWPQNVNCTGRNMPVRNVQLV
ncbi:unnamed protein product [Pieris brassicae]|uniref:Chitin-binding type-2 domain-containing protein n=1 Tax=Pieris brassicae TaxID=7116 RepID=A0A9P0X6Y9_PIEBR|nr:unnamed protein product [Pieris brassicae]